MASAGKKVPERADMRERLIEEAARLIHEEGYAALTAGRLAKIVGLSRQSVHYHFGTIDDLVVAVIRQGMKTVLETDQAAMQSDNPLSMLWDLSSHPHVTTPVFEFIAIALRSELVSAEMKVFGEALRSVHLRAINRHFELLGVEPPIPPVVAAIMIPTLAYHLAFERRTGITMGHEEVRDYIQSWIADFAQGKPPTASR